MRVTAFPRFELYDVDHGGTLESDEVKVLARSCGKRNLTDGELKLAMVPSWGVFGNLLLSLTRKPSLTPKITQSDFRQKTTSHENKRRVRVTTGCGIPTAEHACEDSHFTRKDTLRGWKPILTAPKRWSPVDYGCRR